MAPKAKPDEQRRKDENKLKEASRKTQKEYKRLGINRDIPPHLLDELNEAKNALLGLDDELHDNFTRIRGELESAQQQLIKRSTRVTNLENQLNDERAKNDRLLKEGTHQAEKQKLLESQLSTLKKIDGMEKGQTDAFEKLQTQLQEAVVGKTTLDVELTAAKSELTAAKSELIAAKSELTATKESVSKAQLRISTLESNYENAENLRQKEAESHLADSDRHRQQIQTMTDDMNASNGSLARVSHELKTEQDAIKSLRSDWERKERNWAAKKLQHDETVKKLREEISAFDQRLLQAITAKDEVISGLTKSVQDEKEEKSRLQGHADTINVEKAEYLKLKDQAMKDLSALRKENSANHDRTEQLLLENARFKEEISTLHADATEAAEGARIAKEFKRDLQQQIEDLQAKLTTSENDLLDAQRKVAATSDQKSALSNFKENAQNQLTRYQQDNQKLNGEIMSLKEKLSKTEVDLHRAWRDLESEKNLHERELNSYKGLHDSHNKQLNEQVKELQNQNQRIRGDCESNIIKSQKLQSDLIHQKSELEKQYLQFSQLETEKSSLNLRLQDVLTRLAQHSDKATDMENQIQRLENSNFDTDQRLKAAVADLEKECTGADTLRQLLITNKTKSSQQLELKCRSGAVLVHTLLTVMTALRGAHVQLNFELQRNRHLISTVGERNGRIKVLAQSNATGAREKRALEIESTNRLHEIQNLHIQLSNNTKNLESFEAKYEECSQGLKKHSICLQIAVKQIVDLERKLKSANRSFNTMKINYNQKLVTSNILQDNVYTLRDENHNSRMDITGIKVKSKRLQCTIDKTEQESARLHRSLIAAQNTADAVPRLKQELAAMRHAHQSLKHTMTEDYRFHEAIAGQLTRSLQIFSDNCISLKDKELSTQQSILTITNAIGLPPDQSVLDIDTLCQSIKDLVTTKNSAESEANDLRNSLSNKELELSETRKMVDEAKGLADENKSLADKYHYTSIEYRKNVGIVIKKIKADHEEHMSALIADYQGIITADRNTRPGEIPQYPPSKMVELQQKRAAASSEPRP